MTLGPGTDRVFGLCDEVYIDVTFNRALNVGDPNTDGNVPSKQTSGRNCGSCWTPIPAP